MGRGKYGEENSPSELGDSVWRKREGWAWFEEAWPIEQSFAWKMDMKVCL